MYSHLYIINSERRCSVVAHHQYWRYVAHHAQFYGLTYHFGSRTALAALLVLSQVSILLNEVNVVIALSAEIWCCTLPKLVLEGGSSGGRGGKG